MTGFLATAGVFGSAVVSFGAGVPALIPSAHAQTAEAVDVEALMKPGALEDMVLGDPAAKVTIVEYLSLTCPHCAAFHKNTYPELKAKYVDTGKVKFVMREFPLDQVAWAGIMIARCADKSKFFPLVGVLLDKQQVWAGSQDPAGELFKIAKQAGVTKEQFDACLQDKELAQNVIAVKDRAAAEFKVGSTPSFFVNGQPVTGNQTIEEFAKLIDPLL